MKRDPTDSGSANAVRLAYEELDRIINSLGDGICVVDKEFNIIKMNRAFERLSEKTGPGLLGNKCYEILGNPICRTPECPLVQILQGKDYVETYMDKLRADGTAAPYILAATPLRDAKGELVGIVEDFRNITVRKRIQKALEEQVDFLQKLIDTMPNPLYYKDMQGIYRGCNSAFEECIGLKKEDIIGKSAYDIYPKDIADQYHNMDSELFSRQGTQIFEAPFVCAYGGIKHVIYKKAALVDMNGSLGGIVGMIIDITDRKRAEEEREKLIEDLREALAKVKTLSGLLPICASCKKIRDDKGYWNQIEKFISEHSEAEFSHGICPECITKLYPELNRQT
ncbi:MAG: PAS domain-containing protein [Pseudomonadota bacterium]